MLQLELLPADGWRREDLGVTKSGDRRKTNHFKRTEGEERINKKNFRYLCYHLSFLSKTAYAYLLVKRLRVKGF